MSVERALACWNHDFNEDETMKKNDKDLSQTDHKNAQQEAPARRALSEAELAGIIGGFNPQPEPPASSSYGPRSRPGTGGFTSPSIRGF